MNNTFSYIHIPFCTSKCSYCRFASFWNLNLIKIDIYVKYLIKEIQNKKIDFNNLRSIYFGWGTPGVLLPQQLEKIINTLKQKINFDKNIEINIETTPITVTKNNLIAWKEIWVNRLSIWVQSLNNDCLVEIWRGEKGDIILALDNIQQIWFNNISIDFIIWLPYVKKWEIKKDIEYILNNYNFIKHISVYMLEEHYYPWKWDNISINDDDYLWEYIEIKNYLTSKWFNRYEISNYALAWYESKHNKSYWNHSNIIAYWLWAHWFENRIRYSNSEKFVWYYSWKQIKDKKLNKRDYLIEKVMFGLRTDWINNELYKELNTKKIDDFIDEWFLIKKSDKVNSEGREGALGYNIIVSNKGVLVLDYILGEIL